MARKPVKINAIRGRRLKELLEENGIDQKKFADEIGYSAEHISYIINGKRNLTEDAAKRIVEKFPGTRIGWLLGYDDTKTESETLAAIGDELLNNHRAAHTMFEFAAKFLGYRIEKPEIDKAKKVEHGPDETCYLLIKDNTRVRITRLDIDTFKDELARYAIFSIEGLISKKNDSLHPFIEFALKKFGDD